MELKDRFTEIGYEELNVLFKTLINLFNSNDKWNQELLVLGFGKLFIEDREECYGRIKQMAYILGLPFQLSKITNENGVDYKIEYG